MKLEDAKIVLIESCINSINNGAPDEDVQREIIACITLAKTINNMFERHLKLSELNEIVNERVNII